MTSKFACLALATASTPPNILIMLTDDQGWGDNEYNCENSTAMCARTPNIAAFAKVLDPCMVHDEPTFEHVYLSW